MLFAAAVPVLWVVGRRMLGTTCAYAMACAYALSRPIAEAAAFQFHEFAFMPLLTALLFERWQAGRRLRAPWVIADTGGPQPMIASRPAQLADVRLLRDCGYEQLYDRDGHLVLHAASPGSATPDLTPHRCTPDPAHSS
nr:hypothetical protein [Microbispora cellulosiformans]